MWLTDRPGGNVLEAYADMVDPIPQRWREETEYVKSRFRSLARFIAALPVRDPPPAVAAAAGGGAAM